MPLLKHSFRAVQALPRAVAMFTLFSSSSVARFAAAEPDTAACVEAHASGQRQMKTGRLKDASELFAACASTLACPVPIREECVAFYARVQESLPSVVFSVRDERGTELTSVRVYSSNQLIAETIDGRAVPLDPGIHQLRFELPSGQILTQETLVREGEQRRLLVVRAPLPVSAPSRSLTPIAPISSNRAEPRPGLPAGFWIATSLGAAALASGGAFAILGHRHQSLLEDCSPRCSSSERAVYDDMRREYLIADLSFAVAGVSAGVATWLFFSSARSSENEARPRASTASLRVRPHVSPTSLGLVLTTELEPRQPWLQ